MLLFLLSVLIMLNRVQPRSPCNSRVCVDAVKTGAGLSEEMAPEGTCCCFKILERRALSVAVAGLAAADNPDLEQLKLRGGLGHQM